MNERVSCGRMNERVGWWVSKIESELVGECIGEWVSV